MACSYLLCHVHHELRHGVAAVARRVEGGHLFAATRAWVHQTRQPRGSLLRSLLGVSDRHNNQSAREFYGL